MRRAGDTKYFLVDHGNQWPTILTVAIQNCKDILFRIQGGCRIQYRSFLNSSGRFIEIGRQHFDWTAYLHMSLLAICHTKPMHSINHLLSCLLLYPLCVGVGRFSYYVLVLGNLVMCWCRAIYLLCVVLGNLVKKRQACAMYFTKHKL